MSRTCPRINCWQGRGRSTKLKGPQPLNLLRGMKVIQGGRLRLSRIEPRLESRMAWTLLIIILVAVLTAGGWLARRAVRARRRSMHWNNLHERGQLFAAQLVDMREAEARKTRPEPPKPPRTKAEKARYYWPQRAALLAGPPAKDTQPRSIASAWN